MTCVLPQDHALLNRITAVTSEEERKKLALISRKQKFTATLLPIRTVGVQGDCRSYSYAVGVSSEADPNFDDLVYFARLIPRVCHNINRICYVFGGTVEHQSKSSVENIAKRVLTKPLSSCSLGRHPNLPDPERVVHDPPGRPRGHSGPRAGWLHEEREPNARRAPPASL
jgi:hypothetical protein